MIFEQNLECVVGDLVTENAALLSRNQAKERELAEAQLQLREKVSFAFIQALHDTFISNLQEEQVTSGAENYSRLQQQLREKVSVNISAQIIIF